MAEPRIGVVYNIPPQPPSEADTVWLPAGAVTIGIEYRDVRPEALVKLYGDNPEQLREMLAKSPNGGFQDEGVSLHVRGTADGHEYLRFDVFESEPHYHYVAPGPEVINNVVVFDPFALGDMFTFAIRCLRERLPEMLGRAGGGHLVAELDTAMINTVVDEVQSVAKRALDDVRQLRAASGAT